MRSAPPAIADAFNAHPNLTADAGAVLFGDAVTITADGPWQHMLHQLTGRKWGNLDVENETGCGIVPYVYKRQASRQRRAVGGRTRAAAAHQGPVADLPHHRSSERRLLLAISGDHPAADGRGLPKGADQAAPGRRAEPHRAGGPRPRSTRCPRSPIITSAGPARALGLSQKGHLGVGADADVTMYPASPTPRAAVLPIRATCSRPARSSSRKVRCAD